MSKSEPDKNHSFADKTQDEHLGIHFEAPEANILIVDDIASNLRVTEALMAPYKMRISVCKSGPEAIKLVTENIYDIVFLDHIMPGMDGTEVAEIIREMEGDYYKSLPIIALTGNTASGAKQMLFQKGMSDFLSKPVVAEMLDDILLKWLPDGKLVHTEKEQVVYGENDFIRALRNISELSVDKALAVVGGSCEVYERAVRMTARMFADNIKKLDELIGCDLSLYYAEIHGIKGVLNNIGAYSLGELATELEDFSSKADRNACETLHPQFVSGLNGFLEELMKVIDEESGKEKPDGDKNRLLLELPNILRAAEYYDSALALELLGHIQNSTYGQEIDNIVEELMHAFEVFDFDAAAELVHNLEGTVSSDGY